MDCRTVHDHLSTYLDHDVPLHMRLVLDQHFESCPQCCQELAQLHTVSTWVRDFPRVEPSPMFLQHVRDQVERLPHRSKLPLFRRLAGALPLQVAAALVVVVSTTLVWQMTPHVQQGHAPEVNPPAHIAPWLSREHRGPPPLTFRRSTRRSKSPCRHQSPLCRHRPDRRDSRRGRNSCASGARFLPCHC